MKKIKIITKNEISVTKEHSVYCDFCGEADVTVFTSSFDERKDGDSRKCFMQICEQCIKQLSKFVSK